MDAPHLIKQFREDRQAARNTKPTTGGQADVTIETEEPTKSGEPTGNAEGLRRSGRIAAMSSVGEAEKQTAGKEAAETPSPEQEYQSEDVQAMARAYKLMGQLKKLKGKGKAPGGRKHAWQGIARIMLASIKANLVKSGHVPPPTTEAELKSHPLQGLLRRSGEVGKRSAQEARHAEAARAGERGHRHGQEAGKIADDIQLQE